MRKSLSFIIDNMVDARRFGTFRIGNNTTTSKINNRYLEGHTKIT